MLAEFIQRLHFRKWEWAKEAIASKRRHGRLQLPRVSARQLTHTGSLAKRDVRTV